jgi:hypothetical protein
VDNDDGVMVVKADRENIDVSAVFVSDEIERMDLVSQVVNHFHTIFS